MANEKLVVVTMERLSGLVEDRVVNTFPIRTNPTFDPSTDFAAMAALLVAFYNGGGNSPAAHLSPAISRAANVHTMKMYNVAANLGALPLSEGGVPSGSPIAQAQWTLGAAGNGTPVPDEVALVLTTRADSWQSAPVETADDADAGPEVNRPRQRLSGRLFIGPLNVAALATEAVTNNPRPVGFLTGQLATNAETLHDALVANGDGWCVWSRKNAAFVELEAVQVDNAFDTQRRRGVAPSVRTTTVLVP